MNAVQCDYCGKFAPNPLSGGMLMGRYSNKLPDDWFGMGAWKGGAGGGEMANDDERGEFCSRECISAFFAAPPRGQAA